MAAPKMSANKTLIAYETKGGVTEESAIKIAYILRSNYQLEVDLIDLKEQKTYDLMQYRNIIIGSGVRAGRVYGKARKFLENNFSGKKVAFFVSSSMAGTPGSHDNAKTRFVEHTLAKYPNINVVSTEAFGGRIRYLRKTMLDNTDLVKVEVWAEELGKKFTE
jgi:menaquinone-dependent protoporphyrinogen IX oxidase